ncbi:MAG TPA: hypothetical protein VJS44_16990 [Pyrinomonadaceae bacterium]|nr:hypothetical protein [Pyrinomonadaceae bacterium]
MSYRPGERADNPALLTLLAPDCLPSYLTGPREVSPTSEMQYEVKISIDNEGLKKIYDSYKSVTFVKNLSLTTGLLFNLPIAWLSFQPLQQNQVVWPADGYHVYATSTILRYGSVIGMAALTEPEARTGQLYIFEQGHFTVSEGGPPGAYNIFNQMETGSFSFGLAQSASINEVQVLAPLSALPLLYNEEVSLTPEENILLFLSSYASNGTVIPQVSANALSIILSSSQPTVNVGFDNGTNSFYLI